LILPNYFGFYAISFGAQGCVSERLEILTEFPPSSLQISEQPNNNYILTNSSNMTEVRNVYQRSGDFLPRVFFYKKKSLYILLVCCESARLCRKQSFKYSYNCENCENFQ